MRQIFTPREAEFYDKISALCAEYYDVCAPVTCQHSTHDESKGHAPDSACDDCIDDGSATVIPDQILTEWILCVNYGSIVNPYANYFAALHPPLAYTHKVGLLTSILETT